MLIFSPTFRSSKKRPFGPAQGRGFTLIELLVVMSIMVIVTGVMLVNQAKFDSSTILRSLAYSVALSVRQAQVYGTSVLGITTGGNTTYASAYGVYFNYASPGQYSLFADLDGNGKYTAGEDVKIFSLGNGYSINQFCVQGTGTSGVIAAPGRCWIAAGGGTIDSLSIVFKRPNPDAQFYADLSGTPIGGDSYSSAAIQIQNQANPGSVHTITVRSTGLVSVQ